MLLALIDAGLSRDQAYEIVQKNSIVSMDSGEPLLNVLKADARVTKVLSPSSLDMLFEINHFYRHLDYLYQKVLGSEV